MAGAGLQVLLERDRPIAVGEGHYYAQFPRSELARVRRPACVVGGEPLANVVGVTDVVLSAII